MQIVTVSKLYTHMFIAGAVPDEIATPDGALTHINTDIHNLFIFLNPAHSFACLRKPSLFLQKWDKAKFMEGLSLCGSHSFRHIRNAICTA
jgi:hypothetical protein